MFARLALSFDADTGKTLQVSVAKANTEIDAAAVNAAMDTIIAGNLTAKKGAKLVITETTEIAR